MKRLIGLFIAMLLAFNASADTALSPITGVFDTNTGKLTGIVQSARPGATVQTPVLQIPGFQPYSGGIVTLPMGQTVKQRFGRNPSASGASGSKLSVRVAFRLPRDITGLRIGIEPNESYTVANGRIVIVGNGVTDTTTQAIDATATANTANTATGSIAPGCSGNTCGYLTTTVASTGCLQAGQQIFGTGVTAGTKIVSQLTGTLCGPGIFQVDTPQTVTATTISGFHNVTWAGSSSIAFTAPSTTDAIGAAQYSDFVYVKGAQGQVVVVTLLFSASTSYTYYATAWNPYSGQLSATSFPTGAWSDTSDRVTSPTATWGTTSSNVTGNNAVAFIDYITGIPVLNVASAGDSTTVGTSNPDGQSLPQVQAACEALSNANVYLSPIVRGWSGKQASQYYQYLTRTLADQAPNIVEYLVGSQNNFTSAYGFEKASIDNALHDIQRAGAIPILVTEIPLNGASVLMDNERKALNDAVRALPGVIVNDRDAIMSDGGSPAFYKPQYATASGTVNVSGSTMTVTSQISGTFAIGQSINFPGVLPGTTIASGTGPWTLSQSQTTATGVTAYGFGQHPPARGNADIVTNGDIPAIRKAVARFGLVVMAEPANDPVCAPALSAA